MQLLLVLLRSLPYAPKALQSRALQVSLFIFPNLLCVYLLYVNLLNEINVGIGINKNAFLDAIVKEVARAIVYCNNFRNVFKGVPLFS